MESKRKASLKETIMEKEKIIVKVKENIPYTSKNRNLWYFLKQGEEFELSLDTKAGFLVSREDSEGTKKWNIKHKHAVVLD